MGIEYRMTVMSFGATNRSWLVDIVRVLVDSSFFAIILLYAVAQNLILFFLRISRSNLLRNAFLCDSCLTVFRNGQVAK
jgi:hypothetical protein